MIRSVRLGIRLPFGCALAFAVVVAFAFVNYPIVEPGLIPGGDGESYVHLAAAFIGGHFLGEYGGLAGSRYTLGFPLLLMPAVAIGGLDAAVWVSFLAAIVLGLVVLLVAYRVGGPLAAPVAVLLVLFPPELRVLAQQVMSDVPSAALVMIEVALLLLSRNGGVLAAGLLAGALVWLRPAELVLLAAGLVGLTASQRSKEKMLVYVAGALPLLLALAMWQWLVFGSPFTTSYQAAAASPGGQESVLGSFFSWQYVFGPPWNTYRVGTEPNAPVYLRDLLGLGGYSLWPGIGLVGVLGAATMLRATWPWSGLGRFSLAATLLVLATYIPYFYRDERFLQVPAALLDVCAAVYVAGTISRVRSLLPRIKLRGGCTPALPSKTPV